MFEPSELTAMPPKAPLMPAKSLPSAVGDLSLVRGGILTDAVHAILACPAASPFTWRVPW